MGLGKEIKNFVDTFSKVQKANFEADYFNQKLDLDREKAAEDKRWHDIQGPEYARRLDPDGSKAAAAAGEADFNRRGPAIPNDRPTDGKPTSVGDPEWKDAEPEVKALLNGIAAPESAGAYDVRYTPKGGVKIASLDAHPNILEDTPDGRKSSAAGRYQFTGTTWKTVPEEIRGKDFKPLAQDKAGWFNAQRAYKSATGRDLLPDLKSKGLTKDIAAALSSEWEGLKKDPNAAMRAYNESLKRYRQPQQAGEPMQLQRTSAIDDVEPTQYAAIGGMIRKYAAGGFVDGEQSNNDYWQEEAQRTPDAPNNLSKIVHGGLMEIIKTHSLDKAGPAVPDAAPNTRAAEFHQNDGGVTPEDVKAIDQHVDPDGKLTDSLRGIARLNAVYEHYLKQGKAEEANKAAASLLMYARKQSIDLGTVAVQAMQSGREDVAAAALKKAHDQIPTGTTVNVDPKTRTVTEVDEQTGKVVNQMRYTPEQLLMMARATQDGSATMKQLMQVGAKYLPKPEESEAAPSEALTRGIGAMTGAAPATAAPAPRAPAIAESEDEDAVTSPGNAPVQPRYDAKLAASLSPAERKQYDAAYKQSLADHKAAMQKFENDRRDARVESKADRGNYQKRLGEAEEGVGKAYGDFIEEMKKQNPKIEEQITPAIKRTMTTAAQHIYAGNSVTSGQAVMAAAGMLDVDEKAPEKQNFTTAKSGKDMVVKFENGMKAKMPKEVLTDMLAIRAAHVRQIKEKTAKGTAADRMRREGNSQAATGAGVLTREVLLPQPGSTRAGPQTPGLPDYEGAPMQGGDKFSRPLGPRLAIP